MDYDRYLRAQRAYDNTPEPEQKEDHKHNWIMTGIAKDGTTFYKCSKCGAIGEEDEKV